MESIWCCPMIPEHVTCPKVFVIYIKLHSIKKKYKQKKNHFPQQVSVKNSFLVMGETLCPHPHRPVNFVWFELEQLLCMLTQSL